MVKPVTLRLFGTWIDELTMTWGHSEVGFMPG